MATREAVELRADVDLAAFRRRRRAATSRRCAGAAGAGRAARGAGQRLGPARACTSTGATSPTCCPRSPTSAERRRHAIRWTRARIEHEPLGEAAHRDLIRLLALSGDRPAALAAADALADRLRRELRVPPSAQTRALIEEVRRGRVGAAATASQLPLPAPLARTARPAGREAPLTRLRRAWDDACSGTLRIAIATGEPGIGKTTLLGEFARRVHAEGAAVLFGRSDEQGLLPYQPWVEALERHLEGLPPVERERRSGDGALARLLPSLGPAGEPGDAAGERYRAFEAVRTLLEETAARAPRAARARRPPLGRPRLAVAAAPPRADGPRCPRAGRDLDAPGRAHARRGRDASPTCAARARSCSSSCVGSTRTPSRPCSPATTRPGDAAAYRERTGGNPFFLDELLREEAELGAGGAPPPGVREVIGRRIARLPAPAHAASCRRARRRGWSSSRWC